MQCTRDTKMLMAVLLKSSFQLKKTNPQIQRHKITDVCVLHKPQKRILWDFMSLNFIFALWKKKKKTHANTCTSKPVTQKITLFYTM